MTKLEILLALFTCLSGFGNIAQWVNIKALRKKSQYEADADYIENLNTIIKALREENERLQERVRKLEEWKESREKVINQEHGTND